MYYGSGTGGRCCLIGSCIFSRWQHFCVWNDAMAANLKLRHCRRPIRRLVLQVNLYQLMESDFWYDTLLSKRRLWRHFTHEKCYHLVCAHAPLNLYCAHVLIRINTCKLIIAYCTYSQYMVCAHYVPNIQCPYWLNIEQMSTNHGTILWTIYSQYHFTCGPVFR